MILRIIQGENQMTAFFPKLLDEFITLDSLKKVRGKFHFGEDQVEEIREVAEEMLPVMREEAFWMRRTYLAQNKFQAENDNTEYENVIMSLGNGVDYLQESYSEKGFLLQSYIVEVLAGELLMRGYDAYNRYIMEHTVKHVARYHFPGSEDTLPLEMLPGLLKEFTQKITCNGAFCMRPKKSVVFIAELTQDETVFCEGICVGCTNRSCTNRIEDNMLRKNQMTDVPLTYGYRRIFGIVT